jgi:hypothetical protein
MLVSRLTSAHDPLHQYTHAIADITNSHPLATYRYQQATNSLVDRTHRP